MAKNYKQDGNVLTLTAPTGGVVSGGIYAIGALVVVAVATAAAGESFAAHTGGVWSVPAAAGPPLAPLSACWKEKQSQRQPKAQSPAASWLPPKLVVPLICC